MANELTISLALAFSKSNVSASMSSGTKQFTVSGSDYVRETMTVPTSATALPLGGITTPGYVIMVNRDATNYVDVLDATNGNVCVRLKAGEWAMFRFAVTAPAVKANTASVKIEYILIAN